MRELREANWTLPRIADRYGITKNMAAYRIRRYATAKSTRGNQSMDVQTILLGVRANNSVFFKTQITRLTLFKISNYYSFTGK